MTDNDTPASTITDDAVGVVALLDAIDSIVKAWETGEPGLRTAVDDARDAAADARAVFGDLADVIIARSAGLDGATLVIIDTDGEPDGSDGSRPVRVLVNDGTVYEGVPYVHDHSKDE